MFAGLAVRHHSGPMSGPSGVSTKEPVPDPGRHTKVAVSIVVVMHCMVTSQTAEQLCSSAGFMMRKIVDRYVAQISGQHTGGPERRDEESKCHARWQEGQAEEQENREQCGGADQITGPRMMCRMKPGKNRYVVKNKPMEDVFEECPTGISRQEQHDRGKCVVPAGAGQAYVEECNHQKGIDQKIEKIECAGHPCREYAT